MTRNGFIKTILALPVFASLASLVQGKKKGYPVPLNAPPIVFGNPPVKPIAASSLPFGARKVRLRLRQNELAIAYVRIGNSTAEYIIADHGDHWRLSWEINRNWKTAETLALAS